MTWDNVFEIAHSKYTIKGSICIMMTAFSEGPSGSLIWFPYWLIPLKVRRIPPNPTFPRYILSSECTAPGSWILGPYRCIELVPAHEEAPDR